MLVLSRRESERIRVGDSIVVTVVRLGGDKVRIGIEAPDDMLVLRDELESHKCMHTHQQHTSTGFYKVIGNQGKVIFFHTM